jgi:hypothetical protein
MSEHVLRPAGYWPDDGKSPDEWTLGKMVGIATRAGWFDGRHVGDLAGTLDALNDVRVSLLHPAAFIRDGGSSRGEREFAAFFGVLTVADRALGEVVDALPAPPQ